ncbi:hypothetical protein ACFPVS_02590 [Neisseria weixii]|nr:hypothetical protein [Neisseria weixii]
MIEAYEHRLLADFIGENWRNFLSHAAENGFSEADAEALCEKLEQAASQ